MDIFVTAIFYVVMGIVVAVAVLIATDRVAASERWFFAITALLYWPLYLPLLLSKRGQVLMSEKSTSVAKTDDEMTRLIEQVEAEVRAAMQSVVVDASIEHQTPEADISRLSRAWRTQAGRIRELDELLNRPDFKVPLLSAAERHADERVAHCEAVRQENLNQLREVRQHLYQDLTTSLAWVRELVTMLQLARFTGAPAERVDELIDQIESAADGVCEARLV